MALGQHSPTLHGHAVGKGEVGVLRGLGRKTNTDVQEGSIGFVWKVSAGSFRVELVGWVPSGGGEAKAQVDRISLVLVHLASEITWRVKCNGIEGCLSSISLLHGVSAKIFIMSL